MARHTPGPFVVDGQHVRGPLGVAVAYCGEAMIADAKESYNVSRSEAEANARLIAAAPDLLLAAKHLFACDIPASVDFRCPQCEAARSAIAKAEGRA